MPTNIVSSGGVSFFAVFFIVSKEWEYQMPPSFRLALESGREVHILFYGSDDGCLTSGALHNLVSAVSNENGARLKVARHPVLPWNLDRVDLSKIGPDARFIFVNFAVDTVDESKSCAFIAKLRQKGEIIAIFDEHGSEAWKRCLGEASYNALCVKPQDRSPEFRSAGEVALKGLIGFVDWDHYPYEHQLLIDSIGADTLCPTGMAELVHKVRCVAWDYKSIQHLTSIMRKGPDLATVAEQPWIKAKVKLYDTKVAAPTKELIAGISVEAGTSNVVLVSYNRGGNSALDEVMLFRELYARDCRIVAVLTRGGGKPTKVAVGTKDPTIDLRVALPKAGIIVTNPMMACKVVVAESGVYDLFRKLRIV